MIEVEFELGRQLQHERKAEAAAYRLVQCVPGEGSSRAPQRLSFRTARELLARIGDLLRVAASGGGSHVRSSAPQ